MAGIASRGPQVIKEEFNGIAWVVVKEDTSRDWLVDQGFSFKVQSLKNRNEKYKKKVNKHENMATNSFWIYTIQLEIPKIPNS